MHSPGDPDREVWKHHGSAGPAPYADGLQPILDRRDLLLIDPRGVGRSDPISCPALKTRRWSSRRSCSGGKVLSDLSDLATKLRTAPVTMTVPYEGKTYPVVLDEWQLAGTVGKMYAGAAAIDTKLALANALAAARTGDLAPAQELVRAHLVETAGTSALGPEQVSGALTWATSCHDHHQDFHYADRPGDRERAFTDAVNRMDTKDFAPFSLLAWLTRDSYDLGGCLQWPNDPTADAPFAKGTTLADVPTLVLAGDLDANTSTASAKEAAAQFPNARFVEVKEAGHTPTSTPEGAKLVMEFSTQDRP